RHLRAAAGSSCGARGPVDAGDQRGRHRADLVRDTQAALTRMSYHHATPPPPPQRDGCLMALMTLAGLILLLPGICALGFAVGDRSWWPDRRGLLVLWGCRGIGGGGIVLIGSAAGQPRRPP